MKKLTVGLVVLALAIAGGVMTMGGQRGAPVVPAATGPLLDMANKLAEAINKQDAATLSKMLAPDCVYLDEDGHSPAPSRWVTQLTTGTPAKHIEISGTHGQLWDNAGWVSFNYVVGETYKDSPKNVKGTASIVVKKSGNDWLIQMIHGALFQKVAGLTDGN